MPYVLLQQISQTAIISLYIGNWWFFCKVDSAVQIESVNVIQVIEGLTGLIV